jgi:hypothetical protein
MRLNWKEFHISFSKCEINKKLSKRKMRADDMNWTIGKLGLGMAIRVITCHQVMLSFHSLAIRLKNTTLRV